MPNCRWVSDTWCRQMARSHNPWPRPRRAPWRHVMTTLLLMTPDMNVVNMFPECRTFTIMSWPGCIAYLISAVYGALTGCNALDIHMQLPASGYWSFRKIYFYFCSPKSCTDKINAIQNQKLNTKACGFVVVIIVVGCRDIIKITSSSWAEAFIGPNVLLVSTHRCMRVCGEQSLSSFF